MNIPSPQLHNLLRTTTPKSPCIPTPNIKMFIKAAVIFSAIALVVAIPTQKNSCNVGSLNCCDSVQNAGSPAASEMLGSLGVVLQDLNVPVGLTCTPLSVIGLGTSGNCNANPVCCENDTFNGVIAVGCNPINVNV